MAHEYGKETLSKEFKSDLKGLPDSELVEAVVALANTDGGCVYLGVEDDGTPTGVKQKHRPYWHGRDDCQQDRTADIGSLRIGW